MIGLEGRDILRNAVALAPRLRERAPEAKRLRRLPAQSVADLKEAGVFKGLRSRRHNSTADFESLATLSRSRESSMHMHQHWRRIAGVAILAVATVLVAPAALAQGYPARPVRIVAGFPPGGGTDVTARILGQKLSEMWGQQIVVENRAGASGTIAADLVAKAPPDGYTLLMGLPNSNVVAPFVFPKLPYDPVKDFTPVALVSQVSLVLTLYPGVPANDLKSFIALSKTRQLRYASSGNGSVQHLSTEHLKFLSGADLLHIPYKGSGQAVVDLMAGQVDLNLDTMPTVLSYIKAGRLKAIAVGALRRTVQLPDVPTIAESGLPGFEATNWYGLFAPAGVPKEIVARINADVNRALQSPEIRDKIVNTGGEPMGGGSEAFATFVRSEVGKWGKTIKDANIKFD